MKRASLILNIVALLLLGIGIWYGNETVKYLGIGLWLISSLSNLIPLIKMEMQKKVEDK